MFSNKNIIQLSVAILVLTFLGIFFYKMGGSSISSEEKLKTIERNINDVVSQFNKKLNNYISENENYNKNNSNLFLNKISDIQYPLFVFEKGELTYWSDNKFIPSFQEIQHQDSIFFIENRKGQFIGIKYSLNQGKMLFIGLVPVYVHSQIDNRYLHAYHNDELLEGYVESASKYKTQENKLPVKYNESTLYFIKLSENRSQNLSLYEWVAILLISIALLILMYSIAKVLLSKQMNFLLILVFLGVVASIRLFLLYIKCPRQWINIDLFDPQVFASSAFTPSLGDLLLHLVFLLYVVIVLLLSLRTPANRSKLFLSSLQKNALNVLLIFIAQGSLYLLSIIIRTIYHNSQLSIDITQSMSLDFGKVAVYIAIVIGMLIFFVLSHVCFARIALNRPTKSHLCLAVVIGSFLLLCIEFFHQEAVISVALGVFYCWIVNRLGLATKFFQISYLLFLYLITCVLVGSVVSTYSITNAEKERTMNNKRRFAEHFLLENDIFAEYLLAEAIGNISNDVFIKSRIFSPFILNKDVIKEKIERYYLNNYFDKYQVDIHVFNGNGINFDGSSEYTSYQQIKDQFDNSTQTDYKHLFYSDKIQEDFSKRYAAFITLTSYGITAGYVVLDLKLKRVIPDNVYPELLLDSRFLLPFENKNYAYAIYDGNILESQSGDYNYQLDFSSEYLETEQVSSSGFDHSIFRGDRKVVVSSKQFSAYNVISNFSFLLLILTFLIVVVVTIYTIYYYLSGRFLYYSTRIQLYFNFAFFIPLIAVSASVISLVTASYTEEVVHENFKKARQISRNLQGQIEEYVLESSKDAVERERIEKALIDIAKISNSDASLFDTKGRLLATSQPLIYKKGVLSRYLSTSAMTRMVLQRHNKWTVSENVSKLVHNNTYLAINSGQSGNLLAILSVPYFQSESNLEKEKIEVFTTIINIFTFIFIIFLVISYLVTKWLTFPLIFITQKLKRTTLSDKNELLHWHSNDEIGLMVSEYNKMVINLEDSKKQLAKTQKETAWRQIAQQVAHEIKNPITPMKLTLQQLMRNLTNKTDIVEIKKPVKMLLNQVDMLKDIATSFSSFAKMPIPEQEQYDITQVVKNTTHLFESDCNDVLIVTTPDKPLYSIGDEKLMGRIISNIIINAKQSDAEKEVKVSLTLEEKGNKILLTIKDDGKGIPEEIKDKVFIPNFSTKKSGSGIGLAIAKHGIEHSGGSIWFEVVQGEGTVFYIELPLEVG